MAEAYGWQGRPDEDLQCIEEALALAQQTGEHWCDAELHRLAGELMMMRPHPEPQAAEARMQRALSIARRQQAKSWELRAATSLARLQRRGGYDRDGYPLLGEPLYFLITHQSSPVSNSDESIEERRLRHLIRRRMLSDTPF